MLETTTLQLVLETSAAKRAADEFGQTMQRMGAQARDAAAKVEDGMRGSGEEAEKAQAPVKRLGETAKAAASSLGEQMKAGAEKAGGAIKNLNENHVVKTLATMAKLAASFALGASGLGLLGVAVFPLAKALGPLGTLLVSTAALWFTFSSACAGARLALKAYLVELAVVRSLMAASALTFAAFAAAAALVALPFAGLVAAFVGFKSAISQTKGAEKDLFGLAALTGSTEKAKAAFLELSALTTSLPFEFSDLKKGYETLYKASEGALTTSASLRQLADVAAFAQKDLADLAEPVADLWKAVKAGDEDDTKKAIESLQKLGVFSESAAAQVRKLQDAEADAAKVWAAASDGLSKYAGSAAAASATLGGAETLFSNSTERLKAAFGAPIADKLGPFIGQLSKALEGLVPIANAVGESIGWVLGKINGLFAVAENAAYNGIFGKAPWAGALDAFRRGSSQGTGASLQSVLDRSGARVNAPGGGGDTSSSGGGRHPLETDTALIQKFTQEVARYQAALAAGSISSQEFTFRTDKLKDTLQKAVAVPGGASAQLGKLRTEQEEALRYFEELKRKVEDGTASMGESVRFGLEKAIQGVGKLGKQLSDALPNFLNSFADGAAGAFTAFVTGTKSAGQAFREFASSLLADASKMIAKLVLLDALKRTLGIFGIGAAGQGSVSVGGDGGAQMATIFDGLPSFSFGHSGLMVGSGGGFGSGGFMRAVSPLAFAGAPRFHSGGMVGLGSGEVPIIAKRGEVVGWPEQMRAAFGGGDTNVSINVNQTGESDSHGDVGAMTRELESAVVAIVAKHSRTGGALAFKR